ncbi:uroporphyrinogen-III synthase [Celerinatantimonas yamalensis]|uniref:Uroporphyrinogen-III synthase n=1 Tax=Celerinatantimonas yamalensis TaxID=559956 RepID=A0ABW9G9E1_9GAMM
MKASNRRFLLTRPQPANSADTQQLRANGVQAWGTPLLDFKGCLPFQGVALANYFRSFDTIIALSPRSSLFCQPEFWPDCHYVAMGDSSAQHWRQLGLDVTCPEQATSEGMLAYFQVQPNIGSQQLLILRGQISRNWLPTQLQAITQSVTELCSYQQMLQPISAEQFAMWQIQGINVIVCSSATQVTHLIHTAKQHQAQSWLASCSLAVPSARVAQLIDFPFHHVYNCRGANCDALLATLESIV